MDAMKEILLEEVENESNIIGSHTRYLRKANGTLKVRICPWGNHEIDKDLLRTDCSITTYGSF